MEVQGQRPGGVPASPRQTLEGERCPAGRPPLQRALSSVPVPLARPAGGQSSYLEPCFSCASVHAEPQNGCLYPSQAMFLQHWRRGVQPGPSVQEPTSTEHKPTAQT